MKKVPVVTVAEPEEAARLVGLPFEATVELTDLAAAVKEGLLGFCADVRLMVMRQMLDAEMTERVGAKHANLPDRTAYWHGTTTGPVVLGGRVLSMERPRGRTVDGAEVELDSWGGVLIEGSAHPVDGGTNAGGDGDPPPRRCRPAAGRRS